MLKRVLIVTILIIAFCNSVNVHAKKKDSLHKKLKEASEWVLQCTKDFEFMMEEISILAEVIYHENWYTDKEKKTAYYTGAVVNNRKNSKDYPNTIKGVVYQSGQYSTTKKFFTVELPEECYTMARQIYYYGTPDVPENVVYQATFRQGSGDWIPPINGEHFCYR